MPVNLSEPLRWKTASADEVALLKDLQANILKGHGRAHAGYLFFRFDPSGAARIKSFLRQLNVSNALDQLRDSEDFRATGKAGPLIRLCMLSAAGYKALGVLAKAPADSAFRAGIQASQKRLNDPPSTRWDMHYRQPIHAMILLADSSAARVQKARFGLLASLPDGMVLIGEEVGTRINSLLSPGEGIEHFGYVDGRSNPLMLEEDIEHESRYGGGISRWSPRFGLGTVLVHDPAPAIPTSFGSLVVFRKLEQDVQGFKQAEKALARVLRLTGKEKERAGAMMLGRFEDGTPVVLQDRGGFDKSVRNDFDYADDPSGSKCPFHAHIRKMNPRGETLRSNGKSIEEERSHAFVRRGITYGKRVIHPNSNALNLADMPSKDVGVLFMAYQSNIQNQFEFLQSRWANSPAFVSPRHVPGGPITGIDPIIGQGPDGGRAPKAGQSCPMVWGAGANTPRKQVDFQGFVRMRGGEYFFAPSIRTLNTL